MKVKEFLEMVDNIKKEGCLLSEEEFMDREIRVHIEPNKITFSIED